MIPIRLAILDYQKSGTPVRVLYIGVLVVLLLLSHCPNISTDYRYLWLIPIVMIWLWIESQLYHRISYQWGQVVLSHVIFIIDVAWGAIFIAAMQGPLVPGIALFSVLIIRASFLQLNRYIFILALFVAVTLFYLGSFAFDHSNAVGSGTLPVQIVSTLGFTLFSAIVLYSQQQYLGKLVVQKQRLKSDLDQQIHVNRQLTRFIPEQLGQIINQHQHHAKVEYRRCKITVFFSDIQGFTDLSERLIAEDLAFLLNDYLKHMTEIAKQYDATIDKFMGDGILMFFGSPNSRGVQQDAVNAVDMAIAMRQKMRILRERWVKMGFEALHIRMGLASGYCHVGNYGASHRMSYTILGRSVNLASRLQTAADIDEILVSEETFNLIKEFFLCTKTAPMNLKGIGNNMYAWQVVERYNQKIEHYQRFYDIEQKGFNLILNLEKATPHTYPQIIEALQKTIKRIELQQKEADTEGVISLHEDNIIRPNELHLNLGHHSIQESAPNHKARDHDQ